MKVLIFEKKNFFAKKTTIQQVFQLKVTLIKKSLGNIRKY
jgi:hypothetical protein